MKKRNIIFYSVLAGALATACELEKPEPFMVEKPVSVEMQERIDAFDPLKTYVAGMQLGAATDVVTYTNEGVPTRLINSNFTELMLTAGTRHSELVAATGFVGAEPLRDIFASAKEAGLNLYAHGLVSNEFQNSAYLNATIAPVVIPATGGPAWVQTTANDFETDERTNIVNNNGAVVTYTADGEGANGEGRALKVTNDAVRTNDWESQVFLVWDQPTAVGERYRLTMDIKADQAANFPTQAQVVAFQYKHWDFFGQFSATTEWQNVVVEITINDNTSGCAALAFNLGSTATSFYFDNMVLEKFDENAGGGPTWELLSGADFETDDASNYQNNGANAVLSFTASGAGANGEGRALVVTNSAVRTNDWESQLFFVFGTPSVEGQQLRLSMDVKADVAANIPTQAQTAPGAYKHWNFFNQINATTEWTSISVPITVTAETSGCNTIAFNLGATATSYYFDNIKVEWWNEDAGGEQIIERTPEEKRDTLTYAMGQWISGMMGVSDGNVTAWEVIKDALNASGELRGSNGAEVPENTFFWQDYLGEDYGVIAFQLAREHAGEGDLLFISENGLENSLTKCQGLIDYVEHIEAAGATVDGIATQMHLNLATDKTIIQEMFQLLAATGKKIKISELNVSLAGAGDLTMEVLEQQAEMYKYVLETYAAEVPAAQRYGVTIMNPTDVAGTLQGLWYSDFTRKPAYASFAEALDAVN